MEPKEDGEWVRFSEVVEELKRVADVERESGIKRDESYV